jgi:hypothetical protein
MLDALVDRNGESRELAGLMITLAVSPLAVPGVLLIRVI